MAADNDPYRRQRIGLLHSPALGFLQCDQAHAAGEFRPSRLFAALHRQHSDLQCVLVGIYLAVWQPEANDWDQLGQWSQYLFTRSSAQRALS